MRVRACVRVCVCACVCVRVRVYVRVSNNDTCMPNTSVRLDRLASDVERLHDNAQLFRAAREMSRRPFAKLTIHDDAGRIICNAAELNECACHRSF